MKGLSDPCYSFAQYPSSLGGTLPHTHTHRESARPQQGMQRAVEHGEAGGALEGRHHDVPPGRDLFTDHRAQRRPPPPVQDSSQEGRVADDPKTVSTSITRQITFMDSNLSIHGKLTS